MTALLILVANFVFVFALGFQSRTVNSGQYLLAGFNSLVIGFANLGILKIIPQATETLEIVVFLVSGPLAIMSAMWVHKHHFSHPKTRRARKGTIEE
jgi:hypothetical protein